MKRALHTGRTKAALNRCAIKDAFAKIHILAGCIANDLCELTNIGATARMLSFKDVAIFQSHYGSLACLHCMARKSGIPASTTLTDIMLWVRFLQDVGLEKEFVNIHQHVEDGDAIVKPMFANTNISFVQIFDSNKDKEIKYRAIGMLLHIVQDSFTKGHCERDRLLKLKRFYYYGDQKRHDDTVMSGIATQLANAEDQIVDNLINKNVPVDLSCYLNISPTAGLSTG